MPSDTRTEIKTLVNLKPSALSVDVTNLCNLRCKHCFWNSYEGQLPAVTNPNILEHVRETLEAFPSITNITWYGGEPLIDTETRRLVEKGIELNKKNNLVITNGCFELPSWRERTHFAVSLDGTERVNDYIRGMSSYSKVKKNIQSALKKNISVGIIYCINAYNHMNIEAFIKEWAETGIDGIVFTLMAPIKNRSSALFLTPNHLDDISHRLHQNKIEYPDRIYNSLLMIELIKSKYSKLLANECLMNINNSRVYSIHMRNDGSIRNPCALGDQADCSLCRSVTKIALYAGKILRDKETIRSLFGMYHSKTHIKKRPVITSN